QDTLRAANRQLRKDTAGLQGRLDLLVAGVDECKPDSSSCRARAANRVSFNNSTGMDPATWPTISRLTTGGVLTQLFEDASFLSPASGVAPRGLGRLYA